MQGPRVYFYGKRSMKALRILLISAIVLVVLLGIAVTLAFNSGVQTWAVRRALAQQPDMRGSVGQVAVGLNRVQVDALHIERPGMTFTAPATTIELPVKAAASKQVLIRRLVSKGWVLDLTAPATLPPAKTAAVGAETQPFTGLAAIGLSRVSVLAAAAPAAPASASGNAEAFQGIFRLLELPIELSVDEADLEGDVIFPGKPGQPPGRAHVTIVGGQLGAGKTGEFKITSVAKLDGAGNPIRDMTANSALQAKMDTPRTFESINGTIDLVATGPQFPNGAKLRGNFKAVRGGGSEDYALTLRSVAQAGEEKQVLDVQASYPADSRQLSGTWKLDARDADLAPFSLGILLPNFVAAGQGQFQADSSFQQTRASGTFESTVEKLEVLNPTLSVLGRMRVKGDFDVVQRPGLMRVERLSAEAQSARPVALVQTLQPIELDTSSGEVRVADAAKDLFRIVLEGVPLAWVQPFVQDVSIGGEDARGELVASSHDGGFTVRSVAPLSVRNLNISKAGQPLLQAVNISVALSGDYSPKHGWQADVSEMSLRSGDASWLTVSAKVGQASGPNQPLKATGQYQVDLPGALRQPALAMPISLTKGRLSGDFSGMLNDTLKQVAVKLEARDLVSPNAPQIPVVSMNLRADLQADGVIKAQAPVVIQQGERKSDLTVSAELKPAGAQQSIDAQVISELLYVEDAKILAAPFAASNEAAKPTPAPEPQRREPPARGGNAPTTAPKPDAAPFWSGYTGQIRLALKKVVYSPDVQAGNVSGAIQINGNALKLDNFHAVMGEGSSAKLNGGIQFNSKSKQPYSLDGDVNVSNLNPGPLLTLLSENKQPTVEGSFDMVGKINSNASTPDALGANSNADIKLTSRGGKFHGFAAAVKKIDAAKYQKTVSTAASILGAVSGLMGKNEVAAQVEKGRAIVDVLGRFIEINFDQMNLELVHRPGEKTQIKDFSLISPDLRFIGEGEIDNQNGISWYNQPLRAELQLAVRGDQAKDLQLLGALDPAKDPLGYIPIKDKLPIEGTAFNIATDPILRFFGRLLKL